MSAGRSFDVAVVGGGMAGVSVAAALVPHLRVVLLEAESELAHHTTGRSAAAFLESYGSPENRALTAASRGLIDGIARADGTRLLHPRPLLWVARADQTAHLAELCATVPTLERLDGRDAERLAPVLRPAHVAAAALEPDAQDIDVMALHQHYVRTGRRHGVEIVRGARVTAAVRRGSSWRLTTPDETFAAGLVVNAAGAWADDVARALGATPVGLAPLRRTVAIARTSVVVDAAAPLVADVDERFYVKPEGPNVLVSPADETPSEPCDARPDEVDVALALDRINAATTLGLRSVVSAWAGLRTFAPDRNTVVGPDPRVDGLVWCAGQGGYGIQSAPAVAAVVAHLVAGTPLPRGLAPVVPALSPGRFAR
jgi:D-arginine dehydrogenase